MSHSAELKRAARDLLNQARDGAPLSRETITHALKITGDLPADYEDLEDDEDPLPVKRKHHQAGAWEREHTRQMAPATWICGLN